MNSGDSPNEESPLLHQSSDYSGISQHRTEGTAEAPSIMQSSRAPSGGVEQIKSTVRQERNVKNNLNLRYDYYEYFVYSQCLPAWLLLVLRLIMGGVCTGVFLYMSIRSPFVNFVPSNSTSDGNDDSDYDTTDHPPTFKRHFYLCYLTIWSYLIITIYFITTLINTITMCSCSNRRSGSVGDFSLASGGFKSMETLLDARSFTDASVGDSGAVRQFGLRLQWLLCGVAANAALLVTTAYFFVLYPMIKKANPGPVSGLDLLVHGFNSVFMLVEVLCSGVPVRLVHAVYTALYGLTYALFSLLYWLPDHSNVIYPVLLDWNNAGLTIGMLCLLTFVGLPIIQLIWWLIYLARCFLASVIVSQSGGFNPGLSV